MKARIDQMCDSYRQELTKRQAQNALEAFNHMQTLWEQAANAEIGFVGSAYEGGSELKTACARHRFRVYLRRVRELSELSKAAHFDK